MISYLPIGPESNRRNLGVDMPDSFLIFLIVQALAILGGLVSIYLKFDRRLGAIETSLGYINERRGELRDDVDKLDEQVRGISRTVERHNTLLHHPKG